MDKFWQFAWMLLEYRRLLIIGIVGALVDAACKVGGFGTLTWVIKQFLKPEVTLHAMIAERVNDAAATGGRDLRWVLDYIPTSAIGGLAVTLGVILTLAIIGSIGRYSHEYCTTTASLKTVSRIRQRVFGRLVYLPLASALSFHSAELMSRIVRDSRQVSSGFALVSGKAVRGLLSGAALLIGAFFMDFWLSSLFLLVLPPMLIINRKFGKTVKNASKRALKRYGVMLGALGESFQGIRVVKVHHAESYERRRFANINVKLLDKEMKARTVKAASAPITEVLTMMALMVVMMAAAWMIYERGRDASEVVGVLLMLAGAGGSFRTLAGLNVQLQQAAAAAENLDEVLQMPVELSAGDRTSRGSAFLKRHHAGVEFDAVTFTYPGRDAPALRQVSFRVPFGAVCAVVGPNGSGKTTLLSLLPRLFEPDSGRILIDGNDIAGCTLRSLRRQIAAVTQETTLFEGTIAQNIVYNTRGVSEADMIEAAKRAHAHEFITQRDGGYDAQIGERGLKLSGGQRQRLAIARAILRDPAILILDEATSHIDADSEANITAAMAEFAHGRTTFVIAHRLSTVIDADMIVVLADGAVASIGTHDELLRTSDIYRSLCRTQLRLDDAPPA